MSGLFKQEPEEMAQVGVCTSENMLKKIFSDVKYFLAQEPSDQVKQILKDGGATREFYISDLVTHVIANDTDFSQHPETTEFSLPVVKPEWVLMSEKSKMLLPPAPFSPEDNDVEKIFSGLTVCPSQVSPKDRDVLWAMVTYYGGKVQLRLNPSCTHLVVPNASGAKYEYALNHTALIKTVTPSWVTDCIKNRKILDETLYRPAKETVESPHSLLTRDNEVQSTDVAISTSGDKLSDRDSSPKMIAKLPSTSISPVSPNGVTSTKAEVSSATVTEEVRSVKMEESPSSKDRREMQDVKENRSTPDLPGKRTELGGEEKSDAMIVDHGNEMSSEGLNCLEGCVFVISDYPDCMESTVLDTWIEVIQQHGGVVSSFYSSHCTHLLCLHQQSDLFDKAIDDGKYIVTAHWLNDVLTERCVFAPQNPLHLPVPFENKIAECKNLTIAVTGYEGDERRLLKNMIAIIGAKYTGYMSRNNTHLICNSAKGVKYGKAREWGIPCINANWLSDVVADGKLMPVSNVKYTTFDDSNKIRVSLDLVKDLMAPWQTFGDQLAEKVSKSKKRKLDEKESSINGQVKKSRKLEDASDGQVTESQADIRVIFTGMTGSAVTKLTQVLKIFGGYLAESPKVCTHLVAPKIVRTVKFLSSISVCQHAITPEWLEQSKAQERLLEPDGFAINDKETEESFGLELKLSLERARKQPLLQGMSFYLTPNIQPAPSAMRDIIECAGGQVLTGIPSNTTLKTMKDTKTSKGFPTLVVISCEEDLQHCPSFRKKGFDIHSAEVLLSGVLKQELEFDSYYDIYSAINRLCCHCGYSKSGLQQVELLIQETNKFSRP